MQITKRHPRFRLPGPLRYLPGLGEVCALLVFAYTAILFLALITYVPGDLPSWVPFSIVEPPNNPSSTFGGGIGAALIGSHLFFFGAGTVLVMALLVAFTAIRLAAPHWAILPRLPFALLLLLSGVTVLDLQPFFLHDLPERCHIEGVGGWLGRALAGPLAESLGRDLSLLISLGLYVASLFPAFGISPFRLWRGLRGMILEGYGAWLRHQMRRATPVEQLDIQQAIIENERKRIQEELAAEGIDPQEATPPEHEEITEFPEEDMRENNGARLPLLKSGALPLTSGRKALPRFKLPPLDLLDPAEPEEMRRIPEDEVKSIRETLLSTMAEFGIQCSSGEVTCGPSITRFEFYPATGVRVDKIASLERDLARATSAERINILAPIPGKDTVGIEIANSRKARIGMAELTEDPLWNDPKIAIPLALGKDIYGRTVIPDLARMPHLLIGGTTGSGKSVSINTILASLLLRFNPRDLRLLLIDPKVVEFQFYNELPHLLAPVITDTRKVIVALRVIIEEMEARYRLFSRCKVRNIQGYNALAEKGAFQRLSPRRGGADPRHAVYRNGASSGSSAQLTLPLPEPEPVLEVAEELPSHLPYIVVVIDELADLMQTAQADVESAISRITAKARAAGIHMILATQTPRVEVITGVIKANIPTRIAFQVATKIDSRVILDQGGAERLLGQGDMLYLPPGTSKMIRAQGALVTEEEISRIVSFINAQSPPDYEPRMEERLLASGNESSEEEAEGGGDEDEELIAKCVDIVRTEGKASTSFLQRKLRLGYTRAARIMDILEARGVVGPADGAKPRKVYGAVSASSSES